MKKFLPLSFALFLNAGLTNAAEIVAELDDNSIGGGFGGLSGVMMGAAAGGPIGAVAGAVAGVFGGSGVQESSGNKQKAYLVRTDSGEVRRYRSPKYRFAVGEKVHIVRGRVRPLDVNS